MGRATLNADAVKDNLGLSDEFDVLLKELSELDPPPGSTRLPNPTEAAKLLERMKVTSTDAAEAVAALPNPGEHPELWWLLERCHQLIVSDMGGLGRLSRWPHLPSTLGQTGRYFYLAAMLAALPATRRFHAAHGIPDEIAWTSLGDLGEKVGLHRRFFGVGGFHRQDLFRLHFRGVLYILGRLQFHLATIPESFTGLKPGTLTLELHVPESGGPITPGACEESLRSAAPFFSRHLELDFPIAVCHSWLLDPQLRDYLQEDSNILQFQRRFHLLPEASDGDTEIVKFVFRRFDPDPEKLPRNTTLQRAIGDHLRAGRHWHVRTGWVDLAV